MKIVGQAPRKRPPEAAEPAPCRRGDAWKIGLIVVLFAIAVGVLIGSREEKGPVPPAVSSPLPLEAETESELPGYANSPDLDERSSEPWTGRN